MAMKIAYSEEIFPNLPIRGNLACLTKDRISILSSRLQVSEQVGFAG